MYYLFSIFIFQKFSPVNKLRSGTRRLFPTLCRGLLRLPSMFTFPTTLGDISTSLYTGLKDCADHRAYLRSQPCSGTCPSVPTPCSETVSTTEHVYVPNHARGLVDQFLCRARGLCWPPSTITFQPCSETCSVLRTCFDYSPTIAWGLDEIILIF